MTKLVLRSDWKALTSASSRNRQVGGLISVADPTNIAPYSLSTFLAPGLFSIGQTLSNADRDDLSDKCFSGFEGERLEITPRKSTPTPGWAAAVSAVNKRINMAKPVLFIFKTIDNIADVVDVILQVFVTLDEWNHPPDRVIYRSRSFAKATVLKAATFAKIDTLCGT